MSFSWWCRDEHGRDLFEEFAVNNQALGLPNYDAVRSGWVAVRFRDELRNAAVAAVSFAQATVREALNARAEKHCETCDCPPTYPQHWNMAMTHRFLSIPLERVHRAGGGF